MLELVLPWVFGWAVLAGVVALLVWDRARERQAAEARYDALVQEMLDRLQAASLQEYKLTRLVGGRPARVISPSEERMRRERQAQGPPI